ncbi:MAG: hypothetical protein ACOH13_11075 [Flavobacteriales bacterium]
MKHPVPYFAAACLTVLLSASCNPEGSSMESKASHVEPSASGGAISDTAYDLQSQGGSVVVHSAQDTTAQPDSTAAKTIAPGQ